MFQYFSDHLVLPRLETPRPHGRAATFATIEFLITDGGTRTAAITGAWVAIADAIDAAKKGKLLPPAAKVLTNQVAAISVGIVAGTPVVDLDYKEDVDAHVDMNVAMLTDDTFVEVQGTGEHATFSAKQLNEMLDLAAKAIRDLHAAQRACRA